ncbi:hypothetical protein OH77DRAFT_1431618 [Trametes cingulata]|nr:hypothetical protein OH77DRAFT_1431618 [Trametes cingulata]
MPSTQTTSLFAPLKVHFNRSKSAERRSLRSAPSQPQPQPQPQSKPAPRTREEVDYAPQFGFQALGCKLLSLEDAQARHRAQQPEVDWAPHYGFQALGCKLLSLEDAQRRHARFDSDADSGLSRAQLKTTDKRQALLAGMGER